MDKPLLLGTKIAPYGKIGAVVYTEGERYYMLNGKGVAFMPADFIEKLAKTQQVIKAQKKK